MNLKEVNTNNQSFPTVDRLWHCVLADVLANGKEVGSRDGATIEALDRKYILNDPSQNVVQSPTRAMRGDYMGMELLWYLAGQDETEVPEAFAKTYRRFAQDPDKGDVCSVDKAYCWGAYGARLTGKQSWHGVSELRSALNCRCKWEETNQLELVVQMLIEKPLSRQAIIQLWSPQDLVHGLMGGMKDVPCSIGLQFLIRDAQLRMTVWMRSSDAWLGLPNDIFAFTSMQLLVMQAINREVDQAGDKVLTLGPATFNMTSLHIYGRDLEKATKVMDEAQQPVYYWDGGGSCPDFIQQAIHYFKILKAAVRQKRHILPVHPPEVYAEFPTSASGLLEDCLMAAHTNFFVTPDEVQQCIAQVRHPGLKGVLTRAYS